MAKLSWDAMVPTVQQPDAIPEPVNVDPNMVYLALTRAELAATVAGLRSIGALTLAERLEHILQPPTLEG